jgi:hypothetical protein
MPSGPKAETISIMIAKASGKPNPTSLAVKNLKLTRFRGHPTFWVEGVHDVEAKSTLPT